MSTEKTVALFKALADASRLRTLQSLLDGPRCVEELAQRLDLAASTVSFHLKKLEQVGLVHGEKEQYYVVYRAEEARLETSLRQLVDQPERRRAEEEQRMQRFRQKVLETFLVDDRIERLPAQRKKRRIVLEFFARQFESGRRYDEAEVNEIVQRYHEDYCTVRRELIGEGLMSRKGREYRRCAPAAPAQQSERQEMTTNKPTAPPTAPPPAPARPAGPDAAERKALIAEYKRSEKTAGIFWVRNRESGRVLVGAALNLHGSLERERFLLGTGSHRCRPLQQDWNRLGPEGFEFTVVETVQPPPDEPDFRPDPALRALEEKWIESLQPFADNCYNRDENLRRLIF